MLKRDRYIQDTRLRQKRKTLRSDPTKAGYVLWQELRKHKLGHKFRRQVSIGKFIVDFYCHEIQLIIELDGPIHDYSYQKEYDSRREDWLIKRDYSIIHFANDEVLFDRERVLDLIRTWCKRLSNSRPLPDPPLKGEGTD